MKDAMYNHKNTNVINCSTFFPLTSEEFISSDAFKVIARHYLKNLSKKYEVRFNHLVKRVRIEHFIPKMSSFLKILLVLDVYELEAEDQAQLKCIGTNVEDFYNDWRTLQSVLIIKIAAPSSGQVSDFMEADAHSIDLIIATDRVLQVKIQGYKNKVYLQLQAGTKASVVLREVQGRLPKRYETLRGIPFADSILLRTPLLLHSKKTKRYGSFILSDQYPFSLLRSTTKAMLNTLFGA